MDNTKIGQGKIQEKKMKEKFTIKCEGLLLLDIGYMYV